MSVTTERMLPLYESKLIHQFDNHWATYEGDVARDVTPLERSEPLFTVQPRYWVGEGDVRRKLPNKAPSGWVPVWRGIARSTDARTAMSTLSTGMAGGGNYDYFLPVVGESPVVSLVAAINSFAFDYTVRQKLTGMHLQFTVMAQLPAPRPESFRAPMDHEFIRVRVLELMYTHWDFAEAAAAIGAWQSTPFVWNVARRAVIRAELDAAFFHLYGIARDDVDYIMDTFPIVKRKDEAEFGEYRTKRLIQENYDRMQMCMDTGTEFVSTLDPAPGFGPRHAERGQRE